MKALRDAVAEASSNVNSKDVRVAQRLSGALERIKSATSGVNSDNLNSLKDAIGHLHTKALAARYGMENDNRFFALSSTAQKGLLTALNNIKADSDMTAEEKKSSMDQLKNKFFGIAPNTTSKKVCSRSVMN